LLRTLPRVSEERNQHDMEYPDIPSIPEEQEEDICSTPSRSPVIFREFDPDTPPGLHSGERKDGDTDSGVHVLPWRGVLKKTGGTVSN